MNRLLRRLARHEGFTLPELLIVVTVVGILLAIAVPSYLGFVKKASGTASAANTRSTTVARAGAKALEDVAPASTGSSSTAAASSTDTSTPAAQGGTTTGPDDVTIQPSPGRVRVQRPVPRSRVRVPSRISATTRPG